MSQYSGSASAAARLLSSAASVNATNAVSGHVAVKGINGHNARTSPVYLKLYDKATAPTAGDTPRATFYLPASTSFALDFVYGIEMETGLGYRLTAGAADNDSGALASGDILALNIHYTA